MEQIVLQNGTVMQDNALHGWLAYGSALCHRDRFTVGSRDSLSFGMAKNEQEGFQYILASNADFEGLTCRVSDFTDGKGHTLKPTVYVAWYTDVFKGDVMHDLGFYPDAILPLDDPYQGGTFAVHGGRSQTLYVKVITDKDTVPGGYTASLTVEKDGEALLAAEVSLRVWDITYSDKTETLSLFGYFYAREWECYPDGVPDLSTDEAMREEYADFLMSNRMSIYELPFADGIHHPRAKKYLDDPRLTLMYVRKFHNLKGQYEKAKANGWLDKLIFLEHDEPFCQEHMDKLIALVEEYTRDFPTTQHMNAFLHDFPKDGKNIVERFMEFSTVHSPKIQAFAGEIKETLLRAKKERGDKIVWYVCGNGDDTRQVNMLACTPGTEKRSLFWQQYQQGVDGFFYWSTCWWNQILDIWDKNYYRTGGTTYPYPYPPEGGVTDGVMVYWHPITKKPVGTLGLEAVRDGIEDYQLLSMADRLFGREAVLPYAEKLTTDPLHYVTDAEELMAVRSELAEKVEQALHA